MATLSALYLGLLEFGVLLLAGRTEGQKHQKPNIIVMLADDLGWNDVSFHGSDQIPTPNIDALAYNGIVLNSHYVPALCTPSRASLLTGKYPTSIGMQHLVILAQEPWGLPLEEVLLPEYLKRHGYATHAIGKWHLGFHKKAYTPTQRGFDTFFGYYNGYHDYYDHTMEASDQDSPMRGYDMRRGLDVDYESIDKYSTDAFTDEAVDIIHSHDDSEGPLFMYLAHLAPHAGNSDKPYQAPDEDVARFSYIEDPERRVYAAMVSKLDYSVGRVMTALRATGKLDNSIVLFMSDNGAVTFGVHSNHGSNFPLRGLKESPWEGGVRGVAALWSPMLNRTRRVSNQLMHISDWLPTLFSAAGLDSSELGEVDGKDMWDALSHDLESPRTEVFNNYDEIEDYSSLRIGSWKYITGTAQEGEVDDWYGDTGEEDAPPQYNIRSVAKSEASIAISGLLTDIQLRNYHNSGAKVPHLMTADEMLRLRQESIITCSSRRRAPMAYINPDWARQTNSTDASKPIFDDTSIIEEIEEKLQKIHLDSVTTKSSHKPKISRLDSFTCDPRKTVCLFNLDQDPCEELNLAHLFPNLVSKMEDRLAVLKKSVVRPLNQPGDPFSNPVFHNNTWTHWCEYENSHESFEIPEIFNPRIIFYFLDNILVKLITVPAFAIVSIISHSLFSFIQSLLSLVSIIVFVVVSLLTVTYVRKMLEPISKHSGAFGFLRL